MTPTVPVVLFHQPPPKVGIAEIAVARTDRHVIGVNDASILMARRDIVGLAAAIVHEQYHVDHGPDERPAYVEQLRVLRLLGGSKREIRRVMQALALYGRA